MFETEADLKRLSEMIEMGKRKVIDRERESLQDLGKQSMEM